MKRILEFLKSELIKEWRKVIAFLKKLIKKWGKVIGGLVVLILIIAVIFHQKILLDDKIQAGSVVVLIFVTWFYAVQTQKLVEEERKSLEEESKKRRADYGEKRLESFYCPLDKMLYEFRGLLPSIFLALDENKPLITPFEDRLYGLRIQFLKILEIIKEKDHMMNDLLSSDFMEFVKNTHESWPTIKNQERQYVRAWMEGLERTIHNLIIAVEIEISVNKRRIQKVYGYYINLDKHHEE